MPSNVAMQLDFELGKRVIKDGDIVFLRDVSGFIPACVRAVTESPYSHVFIAFWLDIGSERCLMAVEADELVGRQVISLDAYRREKMDVLCSPFVGDRNKTLAVLMEKAGVTKYSITDVLRVGLHERFGVPLKNNSGEICSEMVAKVLNRCSPHTVQPILLSPGALHTKLTGMGVQTRCEIR